MTGYLRFSMALSIAGMVVLPLFGLLLRFQPKFVHGLHVDPHKAERNCYIAAGVYGVVFLISAITLRMCTQQSARLEHERIAHEEKLVYGDKNAMMVAAKKKHSGEGAGRHEHRTSSREDTTIMFDSPLESAVTPL